MEKVIALLIDLGYRKTSDTEFVYEGTLHNVTANLKENEIQIQYVTDGCGTEDTIPFSDLEKIEEILDLAISETIITG